MTRETHVARKPAARSRTQPAADANKQARRATAIVGDFMTSCPYTIGADQPLAAAHELMRAHKIRHLPVLEGGRLVGIVSVGDLHLVETLWDVDPKAVTVAEAMTPDPYAVTPATSLMTVARHMADHRRGAALVLDTEGRIAGIFSTVDALRALASTLDAASLA